MSEHVPGPWRIDPDDRRDMEWNNHIVDQHGNAICFMAHSGGKHPDQDQANAHLIAAAPDLLDVLKRIVKVATMGRYRDSTQLSLGATPVIEDAEAAIAKAEGRTT